MSRQSFFIIWTILLIVHCGILRCEVEFFSRSGCLDMQEWCPSMKDYCEDHQHVMVPMCPLTCGKCPGSNNQTKPPEIGCNVISCEHGCEVTGGVAACTCPPGYRIQRDETSCKDIDECEEDNPCANRPNLACTNSEGSYACEDVCEPGSMKYFQRDGCCKLTEGICGRNFANGGLKLNSSDTMAIRWPWMSLVVTSSSSFCGGILVTPRWVITAAHCLKTVKAKNVQAYFGITNTRKNDSMKSYFQRRRIDKIIIHPEYDYPVHDVAVIRLTRDVNINDHVSTICLPRKELPIAGMKCWSTGYTESFVRGDIIHHVQQEPILVADNVQCRRDGENITIDEYMMCGVHTDTTSQDKCQGVTDGPVVCQGCSSCDWLVAGFSLGRSRCPDQNSYTAFTTIASHEDWITEAMGLRPLIFQDKNECPTFGKTHRPNKWLEWGKWSDCSSTCGSATSTRRRTCRIASHNIEMGSEDCRGKNEEQRNCEFRPCTRWGDYSEWSSCTSTCGGGKQGRARKCIDGKQGKPGCKGNAKQTKRCNTQPCPKWTRWGKWKECSVTCGRGKQMAERICVNGKIGEDGCHGKYTKTKSCRRRKCPEWSAWSSWSQCSRTCGEGKKKATRKCIIGSEKIAGCAGNGTITEACKMKNCPVSCTQWTEWSSCSVTCGDGLEHRKRNCSLLKNSRPEKEEKRFCTRNKCAASWSEWSGWSNCTANCKAGVQTRLRECRNGIIGDIGCGGKVEETRHCNTILCPLEQEWDDWSPWGECGVTCGQGKRRRERNCLLITTACAGLPFQEMDCRIACNEEICAEFDDVMPYCERSVAWCTLEPTFLLGRCDRTCCLQQLKLAYSEWSVWSQCSKSCGKGMQDRSRICQNPRACRQFQAQLKETKPCNTWSCSIRDLSICSVSCGGGYKRMRYEGEAFLKVECNAQPCPSLLSEWSKWTACSESCGGDRKRTRMCLGEVCDASLEQAENCTTCNGTWANWEPWGPCSLACGIGTIQRFRSCLVGVCTGSNVQDEVCVTFDCPTGSSNCADLPSMQSLCYLLTAYCDNGFMRYHCQKSCGLC